MSAPTPAQGIDSDRQSPRMRREQRITYLLVNPPIHHYPTYVAAVAGRDALVEAKGVRPRVIRSLNCAREEIPTFEMASEVAILLRKCRGFLARAEVAALGHHGVALHDEVARALVRMQTPRDGNEHGPAEGDGV